MHLSIMFKRCCKFPAPHLACKSAETSSKTSSTFLNLEPILKALTGKSFFAFDTTLLGLLAGLVANVTSSAVQKRDERFFTRLDELGLSIVANRQDAEPAALRAVAQPSSSSTREFEGVMRARLEEIDALVSRTRQVMQGLSETSARMNAGLSQSMESVRLTVDELGGNVSSMSTALEANAENQVSIQEAIERLSDSLGSFGEGLAELRAEQKALGPVLEQLAGPLELRLVPGRSESPGG